MGRFTIIDTRTHPEEMARVFAEGTFAHSKTHPVYGDFARVYFPTVFGDALTDQSFLVRDGDAPALLVPCSLHEDTLSSYGFPIRLILRNGLSTADARKAIAAAFHHLEETAPAAGIAQALVSGGAANGVLSLVDRACLDNGGRPGMRMRAEASLSLTEDQLRQDIRASYRSLINWGRRNLRLVYVNPENPDRGLLDDYRDFHARVATRVVHNEATWLAVFNHIVGGGGEMTMGYLNDTGELVSAAMVADEEDTALYFSAVYDRERFDKPMGHWPLFDAMLRAKARGRRYFDLGEFYPRGSVSDKEFNIGFFKKGFTSRHPVEVVWTVPFGAPS